MKELIKVLDEKGWEYTLEGDTLYFIFGNSEIIVSSSQKDKINETLIIINEH